MSTSSQLYPCNICNNYVALNVEELIQHQKTRNCLQAVLQEINEELNSISPEVPMELDQPELDFNDSDVMMSEASVESSAAPPSVNLTSPIDQIGESSTQVPSNITIIFVIDIQMTDHFPNLGADVHADPIVYSRSESEHNTMNLTSFTLDLFSIFNKHGSTDALKTEIIHHINDNLLSKLDEDKRKG
ncbi:hypothetical protein G6F56_013654 [Rhizopus delemar]|nr:hypothetical protein G6F56_013654 [Rhizopus delemar]